MTPAPDDPRGALDSLFAAAAGSCQPLAGTFELTSRCNLRCAMCYVPRPGGAARGDAAELTAGRWLELAREATDSGMLFLCLTGGEPLLRPDFFEIYEPLTGWGLSLTILTNATLLSPETARRLAQRPPARVEVSLYGASPSVSDRVTGVPGSLELCLRGVDALLETGRVPLLLKTTLSRLNAHELPAMRELARARGVPLQASWLLTPRRDRRPGDAVALRLPPEEVARLEVEEGIAPRIEPRAALPLRPGGAFFCEAGRASFFIDAAGRMGACLDLPAPQARPLETGFSAAWRATRETVAAIGPAPECAACADEPSCARCPAFAWLENGAFEAPVPYLCGVARERRRLAGEAAP